LRDETVGQARPGRAALGFALEPGDEVEDIERPGGAGNRNDMR
jgi:hypothetical protein